MSMGYYLYADHTKSPSFGRCIHMAKLGIRTVVLRVDAEPSLKVC